MVSFSLLGLQHPEPNGPRRATPTSTFQHRPGHPQVALAAGYFVYGDLFRHEVDHQQLREVLGVDPSMVPLQDTSNDHGFDHLTLRADHYLSGPLSENDWQLRCLRSFCSNRKGSLIVLVPGQNSLRVAVGILGEYLAMVNVPAHTKTLPNEGAYSWGHVLDVVDRRLGSGPIKGIPKAGLA